mmetsp:Transcript_59576/g.169489  ORF Transcript_59576/g.169489 Transcript_59576/m.169489 type:complete len:295 (-) Transcript_59576:128-1012(-)
MVLLRVLKPQLSEVPDCSQPGILDLLWGIVDGGEQLLDIPALADQLHVPLTCVPHPRHTRDAALTVHDLAGAEDLTLLHVHVEVLKCQLLPALHSSNSSLLNLLFCAILRLEGAAVYFFFILKRNAHPPACACPFDARGTTRACRPAGGLDNAFALELLPIGNRIAQGFSLSLLMRLTRHNVLLGLESLLNIACLIVPLDPPASGYLTPCDAMNPTVLGAFLDHALDPRPPSGGGRAPLYLLQRLSRGPGARRGRRTLIRLRWALMGLGLRCPGPPLLFRLFPLCFLVCLLGGR